MHVPGWVHRLPRGGPNTGGYSFPSLDSQEVVGPHSGLVCGSPFSSGVDSSPLELESSWGVASATRRPARGISREPEDVPRGDHRLAMANRSRRRASKSGHTSAEWPTLPHCQQGYSPARHLGREGSFLGQER